MRFLDLNFLSVVPGSELSSNELVTPLLEKATCDESIYLDNGLMENKVSRILYLMLQHQKG